MADGLRSEIEWRETIEVMQGVGAKGTTEQFAQVLRFLIRTQTKVNVNTATAAEIAPILDVSNAVAEALVKHRAEKGDFKTLDDLKKVPGIDAAKLDSRKDRVAFR
jgi:competence protein ComEA